MRAADPARHSPGDHLPAAGPLEGSGARTFSLAAPRAAQGPLTAWVLMAGSLACLLGGR